MVPPDDILGAIPTWVGLYLVSAAAFAAAGLVLYRRVVRLIMLGKPVNRFDHPVRRLIGAIGPTLGTEQGAPTRIVAERPRRTRPRHRLLGVPDLHPQLHPVHLRGLRMAAVLGLAPHRRRREGLRLLRGHRRRDASGGSDMGSAATMGRDASTALLRPDTAARGGDHPGPDRPADDPHPADRGVLRRRERGRTDSLGPDQPGDRAPVHGRRTPRRGRLEPASTRLVGARRRHPGIRRLHPALQTHAPDRVSLRLRLQVSRTDGDPVDADRPGDRRALRRVAAPGLHLARAARRLRLCGLRPMHRQLPGKHQRKDPVADAYRREPEGPRRRDRPRRRPRDGRTGREASDRGAGSKRRLSGTA